MRNLTVLAKWLAGQVGVDVESYRGSTACIYINDLGRKVIKMPEHWVCATDPEMVTLIEGVIDHEALGHGRFTDFSAMEAAQASGVIQWDGLSSGVANILEDVFIERSAIQVYPGVKNNLAETVRILFGRGFFGRANQFVSADPANLLTAGLLNLLRAKLIPAQETVFAENVTALEKLLPEKLGDVWDRVYQIGLEVEKSTSTSDNIALTARIMEALERSSQNQPNEAAQLDDAPADSGSDTGDSGDAQPDDGSADAGSDAGDSGDAQPDDAPADSGSDAGDSGDAQPDDAPADSGSDAGDSGDAQTDVAPADSGSDTGDSGDSQTDVAPADSGSDTGDSGDSQTDDAPTDSGSDAGDSGDAQPDDAPADSDSSNASGAGDSFAANVAKAILAAKNREFKTELADSVAAAVEQSVQRTDVYSIDRELTNRKADRATLRIASKTRAISDDLLDVLETETKCHVTNSYVGKRLQNRVLSRTKTGDARVFRKKIVAQGLSTAVSILVDVSGSMNCQLSGDVTRLDAAMGLVIGLGDLLDEFDLPFEVSAYSSGFMDVKTFDEGWTGIRRSGEYPCAQGGTYSGAAMMRSLSSLLQRDEDRRLLLLITDGDTSDLPVLISCYAEAQEMNVEIASLMIGPVIPSIETLSKHFGFSAKCCTKESDLGKYAVERILDSI